ncbi:MAG: hypothetical protein HZC24_08500 [Rhodocyclales bacterium]|nr:hypothetical protein [Rhodocyclales bacterium]
MKRALPALCAGLLAGLAQAGEFSFDAAEFEKKPLEFGGYVELKAERFQLNQAGTFYALGGLDRSTLDRNTATLKRGQRFDEAYASFKPDPGFTLDIGKQALKWGKGYAWNPVGFVERSKDPNDVELAREGYTMVAADFIRNFDGDLKTLAFTPLLLPVGTQTNRDFGQPNHVNLAAKLYLLYRDTDIDFTWLGNGSRSSRFGVDFSRNLGSALEIHGEWARLRDVETRRIDAAGNIGSTTRRVDSALLGLRYQTENDTTWIAEVYRNGSGYTQSELTDFHRLVASGNPALLAKARQVSQAYGRANAGQRYFYLRASQKEPFDIVYVTPALTLIANADDRSYSLTPELLYTGVTNLDLRLRASWLQGKPGSEFGEKQNARRLELMARFYF